MVKCKTPTITCSSYLRKWISPIAVTAATNLTSMRIHLHLRWHQQLCRWCCCYCWSNKALWLRSHHSPQTPQRSKNVPKPVIAVICCTMWWNRSLLLLQPTDTTVTTHVCRVSLSFSLKPGFHYPSSPAEVTAGELGCIFWHPSTRVSKNAPESTGRQLGPWTPAMNSGTSGNRA